MKIKGDSILLKDHTPKDYTFTVELGELIEGMVRKDTTDTADTLQLRVIYNDIEKVNKETANPATSLPFLVEAD